MYRYLLSFLALLLFYPAKVLSQGRDYSAPTDAATANYSAESLEARLTETDIPYLKFSLDGGKEPDYDLISPPEGCVGASITNNKYVEGALTISRLGKITYESGNYVKKESGIRLKVRGNTSANWNGNKTSKPGYKIKLSKKGCLLDVWEFAPKSKDWVLIPAHNHNLNYMAGFELGRLCGLGWQPRGCYVNVVINDSYKGVYYLCEAVTGEKKRAEINDSGYIIENDPYWWKPDEVFFKSRHIPDAMGWTFKEPDTDDFEENSISNIQWAVSILEDALYNGKSTDGLIDMRSFAAWVLAHDIMNTIDPAGSNIFMIKDSFSHFSPFDTPFRMGPLWDMDTCFTEESDSFSPIHNHPLFYFRQLFEIPEFYREYTGLWNALKSGLVENLLRLMQQQLGLNKGIDAARILENSVTGRNYETTGVCMENLRIWLEKRVSALESMINGKSGIDRVEITDGHLDSHSPDKKEGKMLNVYSIDGLPAYSPLDGVRIIISSDGKKRIVNSKWE